MSDRIAEYERSFAARTGAPHAFAFAHARTGLAAILEAANLGAGDEVLLSPLTCKAVPLAILGAGLRPVYVDIVAGTLNLDSTRLERAITDRTKAVLFQRTYGHAAGAREAAAVARSRGLLFVEDCAQCMPSLSAWLGDAAVFSNNAGKPLSAGSGGVAVVRDGGLASRVQACRARLPVVSLRRAAASRADAWVRSHLLRPSLYWPAFTLNRRFDTSYEPRPVAMELAAEFEAVGGRIRGMQARAGLNALDRADDTAKSRVAWCRFYDAALRGTARLELPCTAEEPLYWYPVLVPRKDALLEEARRQRIEIIPWPVRAPIYPLADVASLEPYGYAAGDCPTAEDVAARLVGLPTHGLVHEADARKVIGLLNRHVGVEA